MFGIKGSSWLATIPPFDVVDGMSADYMHCVLLGVTRMLLRFWFNSKYHSKLWYLGNTGIKLVDACLSDFLVPNEIQRTPRSLEKTMKFWKGIRRIHYNNRECILQLIPLFSS